MGREVLDGRGCDELGQDAIFGGVDCAMVWGDGAYGFCHFGCGVAVDGEVFAQAIREVWVVDQGFEADAFCVWGAEREVVEEGSEVGGKLGDDGGEVGQVAEVAIGGAGEGQGRGNPGRDAAAEDEFGGLGPDQFG